MHDLAARYATGTIYLFRNLPLIRTNEAFRLYHLAAKRGDPESMYDAAFMIINNEVKGFSKSVALALLKRSSEMKFAPALDLYKVFKEQDCSDILERSDLNANRKTDTP